MTERKRLLLVLTLASVPSAREPEMNSQMMVISSTGKRGEG